VKPEFIDNRAGNTLAAALAGHLEWLATTYSKTVELSIATGYFNPEGFALIAGHLNRVSKVRLLLGAEPTVPPARPRRKPGDPRGGAFEARLVREAIELNYHGLVRDRDRLPFDAKTDRSTKALLALLHSGKVEVRRYEKAFLHGKAYVFSTDEGAIVGSSNLTAAGLTSNLELNLGRYDPTPVADVKSWFDSLWEEAAPFDLAKLYEARYLEYDPYLIYLRVLWELYGEELDRERQEIGLPLATFQKDGIWRAKQVLDRFHGVLIADGVGLGKSFIGGELIREAVHDRRQRVLLVAPAALRDGMWKKFTLTWGLPVEVISYEELADDKQLGGTHKQIEFGANEYAMVIVDEAQAFRNPETLRARALRKLLMGKPPKKLVLLSATPVNNSLWDLYYLLTLFIANDGAFAENGVRSLKDKFRDAANEDPDDLTPDALFDILDQVTVRRTRHFVKTYYPNDQIRLPDGTMQVIQFPTPHISALKYDLDKVLPGFFDEIEADLVGDDQTEPRLTMARYSASFYRTGGEQEISQIALVGLIRSGLLKRFESSVSSFALSCERMIRSHDVFLRALEDGWVLTRAPLEGWTAVDSDEAWDELIEEPYKEPATNYDVPALRRDVESDREIFKRLADRARKVKPQKDPKLAVLADAIRDVIVKARNEARSDERFVDNRKVIVFSYFADTVNWIESYLRGVLDTDKRLAEYRGRLVSVAGTESRGGVSRHQALLGFAPVSMEASAGRAADRFDILVTTDVLAEGVNLQQCRNIINYELPWNPMRLVQRHGRIDRIGSAHSDVFISCFFPDRRLDQLLNLEERIRRKLAQAAASIGVESEVIPGSRTLDVVFAQTRQEIQKLRDEDTSLLERGGEDPSAHSGEEYRQELRKALQTRRKEILSLPWAAGSGIKGGRVAGHFFCARIGERVFLRFVPRAGGAVEHNTLKCLKRIDCRPQTPRVLGRDLADETYDAWERARRHIYDEWMFATDPANIQPRIRPFFREAAEHLRKFPPPGVTQDQVQAAVESLEAPLGIRYERALRLECDLTDADKVGISRRLVDRINELGLQPYKQPEPLKLIEADDIELICWMAVDV
jgi:hypothetical protein